MNDGAADSFLFFFFEASSFLFLAETSRAKNKMR
jgi:hypothetical protein